MSTIDLPTKSVQQVEPNHRRWSRSEYYQMLELGWFQNQRVELIDGEVFVMPAQRNFHAACIALAQQALQAAFGPPYWVRNQASLDLGPMSVPDPDLAVILGSPKNPPAKNPTSALLVVEVSDTTLAYDRGRKAALYAQGGIADYWIVNLVDRRLEVYREPVSDSSKPFGFHYAEALLFDCGQFVSPLAASQSRIAVADLFP